ncbi:MAG: UPF0280 family protein [Desulfovibrionales bacterium]|nr:UPF0280 family protein [Desulfovibrionales bacterium]
MNPRHQPRAVHDSPFRSYRAAQQPDLISFQIVIEQTDLWVAARRDLSVLVADEVRLLRAQIQAYATIHPEFIPALSPLTADPRAPEVIQRMCRAAQLTGVGPMAAVAGTIAQLVAEKFQNQSPDILVENGGDTYLCSTRDRHIGILSVPGEGLRLCVPVQAREFPCSFCASSAKIGHSLSFGNADLVVTRSRDAALADAAATALANLLKNAAAMDRVLALAQQWEATGLDGVFAQCEGRVGVWGRMQLDVL